MKTTIPGVQPVALEPEWGKESVSLGRQREQGAESITDGTAMTVAECRVLGSKQVEKSIHGRRQW